MVSGFRTNCVCCWYILTGSQFLRNILLVTRSSFLLCTSPSPSITSSLPCSRVGMFPAVTGVGGWFWDAAEQLKFSTTGITVDFVREEIEFSEMMPLLCLWGILVSSNRKLGSCFATEEVFLEVNEANEENMPLLGSEGLTTEWFCLKVVENITRLASFCSWEVKGSCVTRLVWIGMTFSIGFGTLLRVFPPAPIISFKSCCLESSGLKLVLMVFNVGPFANPLFKENVAFFWSGASSFWDWSRNLTLFFGSELKY